MDETPKGLDLDNSQAGVFNGVNRRRVGRAETETGTQGHRGGGREKGEAQVEIQVFIASLSNRNKDPGGRRKMSGGRWKEVRSLSSETSAMDSKVP